MDAKLQMQFAKAAGKVGHKLYKEETWLKHYKIHLSMVENPLPFGKFKMKFEELNRLFDLDPLGKVRAYDKRIQDLCNAIGC